MMKAVTIKRILAMTLVNYIFVGTRCFEQKRKLLNAIGHGIGAKTKIVGPLRCTGVLVTGENCWIGRNLTIHGNGTVILGDACDIAPDATFLTGGHSIGPAHRRAGKGQTYTIRVEDGCWIGARATIGRQVTVGKGCVVAACACVMKDVPPDSLCGGVPAVVIRKLHET